MPPTPEERVQYLEQGFCLGSWIARPRCNVLEPRRRNANGHKERIRISPKAMQVLVQLATRPGRFFSKDELLSAVWSGRVVTEDVLTGAVRVLRRAMGEDPRNPQIIETRKGAGYRLIAKVNRVQAVPFFRRPVFLYCVGAAALLIFGLLMVSPVVLKPESNRTIAVLPFANLSGDSRGAYVADAMTDALILSLAEHEGLRVISRTSVLVYDGKRKSLPDIAEELQARYLVEGSVLARDDKLRISAQLIDAEDDVHLWTARFDRQLDDIFALQNEVSSHVSRHVIGVVTEKPIIAAAPLPADDLERFLKARYLLAQEQTQPAKIAYQLFEELSVAYPDFSDAHLGKAQATLFLFKRYQLPSMTLSEARDSIKHVLQIEPRRSEAYRCLGQIVLFLDWDFALAETHYRRAIELNASDTVARRRYAWLLVSLQRYTEAQHQITYIKRLDPHYYASVDGAILLLFSGKQEQAVVELEHLNETASGSERVLYALATAYWSIGRYDESAKALVQSRNASGSPQTEQDELANAYRAAGRDGVYRYLLGADVFHAPVRKAALHAQLGDYASALDWLDRAVSDRDPNVLYLAARPEFAQLRDNPRFQALLRRIKTKL